MNAADAGTQCAELFDERRQRLVLAALDASSQCVVLADHMGIGLYQNQGFERMFGYTLEELNRRGGPLCLFPTRDAGLEVIHQVFQNGTWRGDVVMYTSTGEHRDVLFHADAVYDSEGVILGVIGVADDATERKQYESDLNAARHHAESIANLRTMMLGNLSHEVRTPLTAVIGFSEVLLETTSGETREFVQQILANGQRLLDTVSGVLDLIALDQTPCKLEEVDILQTITASIRPWANPVGDKGLWLNLESENCACGKMLTDATSFRRVVDCLMSNALKFTPSGGITVRIRCDETQVCFSVEDTGTGISTDFQSHVFEPFNQESSGLSRAYGGSGIGLSVAHGIAHRLGGSLELVSEKEHGSTFTLTVPRNLA